MGRLVLHLLPTRLVSRLTGWTAALPLPRPLRRPILGAFCRLYGVAHEEAERPLAHYPSLKAFFGRHLRPGLRPVAGGGEALVSPVDGRLVSAGPLAEADRLTLKGARYTAAELLGDPERARAFAGGLQVTLYLCPGDYHRIHAPASAQVVAWRHLPGRILPVNPPTLRRWPRLFPGNERVASYWMDPERGRSFGLVLVGALNVGSNRLLWDPALVTNRGRATREEKTGAPPRRFARGEEMARFELGSTVVLLLPAGVARLDGASPGRRYRVGERLGTWLD